MGMPWAVIGGCRLPQSRGSTSRRDQVPDTWESYREAAKKASRPRIIRSRQTLATPSATRRASPIRTCGRGRQGGEADGKTVVINSKETVESVKFMTGSWKDGMDEGGLAWGRAQQQPCVPVAGPSATLNGASIYIESLRKPEQYKTEKGERCHKHPARAPAQGPAGQFGSICCSPTC